VGFRGVTRTRARIVGHSEVSFWANHPVRWPEMGFEGAGRIRNAKSLALLECDQETSLIPLTPVRSFTANQRSLPCPPRYYQTVAHESICRAGNKLQKIAKRSQIPRPDTNGSPAETGRMLCDTKASAPQRSMTWKIPPAPSALW